MASSPIPHQTKSQQPISAGPSARHMDGAWAGNSKQHFGIVDEGGRDIVADEGAARVEQGPQQGGEDGGARGQDLDKGALEHLVAVEAEIPQEPGPSRRKEPVLPQVLFNDVIV